MNAYGARGAAAGLTIADLHGRYSTILTKDAVFSGSRDLFERIGLVAGNGFKMVRRQLSRTVAMRCRPLLQVP